MAQNEAVQGQGEAPQTRLSIPFSFFTEAAKNGDGRHRSRSPTNAQIVGQCAAQNILTHRTAETDGPRASIAEDVL